MIMTQLQLRTLNHPVGWKILAMESAEENKRDVAYVIERLNVVYDSDKPSFVSKAETQAIRRIAGILELLVERPLIVTSRGAVASKKISGEVRKAEGANLSIAHNLAMLSSPDVDYLLFNEHVPGMTLFTIDMDAFLKPEHPLLIKTIGWWGNDQSQE